MTATIHPSSFTHGGGRGTLTIAAARDCTWSAGTDAGWIAIADARSGQGEAAIDYTVSENPVPSPRSGTITVGSLRLQLSQAAAPCTYSLSPSGGSIDAGGGSLSFTVSTLTGCAWTATSAAGWIAIVAGQSGGASGNVGLRIEANTGGERSGAVNVAGQSYTVTQAANSASPEPQPEPAPPPPTPPPPSPPPPPPPPPPEEVVEFEGIVSSKGGSCPNLTFVVSAWTVQTDGNTEFKGGKCKDLSNGDRVKVRGVTQSATLVRASRVEIREDDDDD